MELMYTKEQQAFRGEVRAWLSENVPSERLPSFDTADGFEAHREWERMLAKDNWGMVTWPTQYLSLIHI